LPTTTNSNLVVNCDILSTIAEEQHDLKFTNGDQVMDCNYEIFSSDLTNIVDSTPENNNLMYNDQVASNKAGFKFTETADIDWCKPFIPKDPTNLKKCWEVTNEFLHTRFGYPDQESNVFTANKERVNGQELANIYHIWWSCLLR
jgi:hypothetical protein